VNKNGTDGWIDGRWVAETRIAELRDYACAQFCANFRIILQAAHITDLIPYDSLCLIDLSKFSFVFGGISE